MATRMQQRRGTAAQWSAANPTLAAGEIGFETDNNRFKIGDGATAWADLDYFANSSALTELLDGAPDALNTLNELAAALGDDASFATTVNNAINTATSQGADYTDSKVATHNGTTNVHGITDTSALATKTYADGAASLAKDDAISTAGSQADGKVSTHNSDTTNVHGIANTADLATTSYVDTALSTHATDTTSVHGIADTSALETQTGAQDKADLAESNAIAAADTEAASKVSSHNADTTDVHGIANTADLATKSYADTAVSTHAADTTSVHGIADTSALETQTGAQDKADLAESNAISAAATAADAKVSAHNAETTSVHGIADTSLLATKSYADTAEADAITAAGTAADAKIADAVAALTKSSVGLANVDNTSDANKPVSTATQTALDLKASLAGATFTGDVTVETDLVVDGNLTVTGTTTTVSAQDLVVSDPLIYIGEGNTANLVDLGLVSNFNDGTYQHSGIVRDSSAGKWKIFKGVTDEPTTTVNFAQGSLDDLAVGALEATTVTPSSGIVFSDGTQTKVGVPSITTFATAISSSATLAAGEQDKFVPLTGAVTITLPATGYSTGQSIDFYQASGTGAQFASTNSVVGTPGLKFRTTNSVVTAMKTSSGWLVFGDLSA